MMTGTGLGWGNLPTDKDLTDYARRLIAKHYGEAALRESAEQAKENALREARRLKAGGVRKDLEGKVVAEDDGGNVTRNRGVVASGSTVGMKVQEMLAPGEMMPPATVVYSGNTGCAVRKQIAAKAKELAPSDIEQSEKHLEAHHKAKREEHNAYLRELRAQRKALAQGRKAKSAVDEAIDLLEWKGAAE
jgi:hypothetical protein